MCTGNIIYVNMYAVMFVKRAYSLIYLFFKCVRWKCQRKLFEIIRTHTHTLLYYEWKYGKLFYICLLNICMFCLPSLCFFMFFIVFLCFFFLGLVRFAPSNSNGKWKFYAKLKQPFVTLTFLLFLCVCVCGCVLGFGSLL